MRLDGILLGGPSSALTALGLDVVDGQAQIGGVTVACAGDAGPPGIRALDLHGAPASCPLPLAAVPPAAPGRPHPVGAIAVDHIVVLAGDVAATLAGIGVEPDGEQHRDGRRYAFVKAGTALLELVGPDEPDDRPARLWGLALVVTDLDAAVAFLGDGCGPAKPAFQPGRRIATVRHEAIELGVPTVLLTPRIRTAA